MKALVLGSTGLVGKHLLDLLLKDEEYSEVVTFVRKPTGLTHARLVEMVIDFDNMEDLKSDIRIDHVYLCLGTTMATAGSKENFYKVDYTYTVQGAGWAQKHGASKVCLVSAIGASQKSWFYYSQVKGQVESDIQALDFDTTIIVRPSLLLGKRKEYRKGEVMAERVSQWFGFLYSGPLSKYRPVKASDVARTMWENMKKPSSVKTIFIESHHI
jgi:uncharacterized protein YbjT (DUF2867 family)